MNRYTFMEMDGALAERLNEILLEMPNWDCGSTLGMVYGVDVIRKL